MVAYAAYMYTCYNYYLSMKFIASTGKISIDMACLMTGKSPHAMHEEPGIML